MAQFTSSIFNNPTRWTADNIKMIRIAGAEIVTFVQYDDHTDIQATSKGKTFRETVGMDGPLAAAGRLSTAIQRYFDHGKLRRAFRTKLRNIHARKHHG